MMDFYEDLDMEVDSETPPKTPPGSPIIGYGPRRSLNRFNSDEYCFECKGPIRPGDLNFSGNGLIAKGDLITSLKLLNTNLIIEDHGSLLDDKDETDFVRYRFFKFPFEPSPEKLKTFIMIARKNISMVENSVQQSLDAFNTLDSRSLSEGDSQVWWELRRDVCNFLNFVVKKSQAFRENEDLVQAFRGLQRSVGRIEAWSAALKNHGGSNNGNECQSSSYHFFHLHLELQWFFLVLSNVKPVIVEWILEDLIYLAWFKYTTEKMSEWSSKPIKDKTAFSCYCVKELWTMIRHVIDEIKPCGRDFWDFVAKIIKEFDKKRDDHMFPLWLITNLAPLKNYSFKGIYSDTSFYDQSSECYSFVREVVADLLNPNQKLSEVMDLLSSLLPFWGSDVGLIQNLLSYWANKIDRTSGFEYNYWKSCEKWVAQVKSLVPSEDTIVSTSDSSSTVSDEIFSFIRLFAAHIRHCPKDRNLNRLTSLIYIKLPDKKIKILKELGLIRLSTMHLAAIYAVCSNETVVTCKRFFDSYRQLHEDLSNTPSARTILTAQLSACLLLLDKEVNIEPLADVVMDQVSVLMLKDTKISIDQMRRELIMVYLEFLDCLPKFSPHHNLGQAALLSPNFPVWLLTAAPDYLNRALRVFHNLLTWLFTENHIPELVNKIYNSAKDIMKKQIYLKQSKNMDLDPLAGLAADFTYLHRNSVSALNENFRTFALDVRVNVEMSRLYLEKLLAYEEVVIKDDLKLLQAWIRLICLGVEVPSKLTCIVMNDMNTQIVCGQSRDALLRDFCECAREQWDKKSMEEILVPVTDLCKYNWMPYKENVEALEAFIRSTSILLTSIQFRSNIYAPRVPCVGKTILDFYSNMWNNITDDTAAIWAKYLIEVFSAITSFHPYDVDQYLVRHVQLIVYTAFLSFTSREFERNYENHPCVKIMRSAIASYESSIEPPPALVYLSQIKLEQKSNTEFLKTLSIFAKPSISLPSVIVFSLPAVLRIVRTTMSSEEVGKCGEIICALMDPALIKTGMSVPVLEAEMKKAFEEELSPNLSLYSSKYFKLFHAMVDLKCGYRAEVRNSLNNLLIPLIREQIKLNQLQRGTGQNQSLWNALDNLEQKIRRLL